MRLKNTHKIEIKFYTWDPTLGLRSQNMAYFCDSFKFQGVIIKQPDFFILRI